MTVHVVGGTYFETCRSPRLRQFYGSGGRAAAALSHLAEVCLHTYSTPSSERQIDALGRRCLIEVLRHPGEQTYHFDYPHGLHRPYLTPAPALIKPQLPIQVEGELVLVFGMMEGHADVRGNVVVYDPQSETNPIHFRDVVQANRLALVGNTSEILRLGKRSSALEAAKQLLTEGAKVVVVKNGPSGALVVTNDGEKRVPAFRSDSIFPVGSGDVFSAAFAWFWGSEDLEPGLAARLASQCVCTYMDSQVPRVWTATDLAAKPFIETSSMPGQIYLASPFFTMSELRVVEEAYELLNAAGCDVFSPYHDVGFGGPEVAPKDLAGLEASNRILAVLDGCDPGTIFEVGYAVAKEKTVIIYSENVQKEKLTMMKGTNCILLSDFSTAIYRTIWGC